MKKLLITGAHSFIGTSFERFIHDNCPDDYVVDTIDMRGGGWRKVSFSGYDCVFHVAGLAHQREDKYNTELYYQVNRDLAVETAEKAKLDGVKQFIFLSSMSVYGLDSGIVTKDTVPKPKTNYGKSKLQAEKAIRELSDDTFRVCILRPPMVYGKGCKGNFRTLKKLVQAFPIFPYVKNQRSLIYIFNLCSFVKMCIDQELHGLFFPQNREYVSTTDMARGIAEGLGKPFRLEYLSGLVVCVLRLFLPVAKKGFGSLVYRDMETFDYQYIVCENYPSFINSV